MAPFDSAPIGSDLHEAGLPSKTPTLPLDLPLVPTGLPREAPAILLDMPLVPIDRGAIVIQVVEPDPLLVM